MHLYVDLDRQLSHLSKNDRERWEDWLDRHQLDKNRIVIGHPMIISDHRIETTEWDEASREVVDRVHTYEGGPLLPPAGFRIEEVD